MVEWKSIHHDSIHTADISPGWHIEITSTNDGWWVTVAFRGLRIMERGWFHWEILSEMKEWSLRWVENEARMTLQALGKDEEENNG